MSKNIFISHAVTNKDLADKLVDLLETGIGISDSEVFCSSLEGMGIPSGVNFVDFIKGQIKEPKVVILLLSKQYFKSQFCLAELGASWILSHRIMPILVPPLEYSDVKSVLTGVQLLKLTDSSNLNQLQEELVIALGIKGKAFARWESKRNKFIESLIGIELSADDDEISIEEFNDINTKYADAVTEIENMEEELSSKDKLIKALKKAKDSIEVNVIVEEQLDDIELFENIVSEASSQLSSLPEIVQEAMFQYCRNENLRYPEFGEDYKGQQIKEAEENDYLTDRGDGLEINLEDDSISDSLKSLNILSKFIDNIELESDDFIKYYSKHYDHRLKFQSRRFWDEHLF